MKEPAESNKERLEFWNQFKESLARHAGDENFHSMLRERGADAENMIFAKGRISFSILMPHEAWIPYTILAGGYTSCMNYIIDEMVEIRRLMEEQAQSR